MVGVRDELARRSSDGGSDNECHYLELMAEEMILVQSNYSFAENIQVFSAKVQIMHLWLITQRS